MLRQLYATPPGEFVAARNEVVKALRRDKRRDEATALAALRRPAWDDWALNVVATEHADEVTTFADAAGALRDAQAAAIEGRDGPDVRTSLRELRDASAALVRAAGDVLGRAGRAPGELTARLSEVAASETAVAQLRAGVLGSGDASTDDLFAGLEPAEAPRRATSPERTRRPAAEPHDDARTKRARAAVDAAIASHRAAAADLAEADAEVGSATRALEDARAALRRAEQAMARARQRRDEAATVAERAAAGVERARADLDET